MGQKAKGHIIQEAPVKNDPLMALNTGYAQSKFIGTLLCCGVFVLFCAELPLRGLGHLCSCSSSNSKVDRAPVRDRADTTQLRK